MNIFKTPEGYLYTNKALLYLFLPLLVEYALEFFVGLADSIMVASLGEAAISGVSLVDFLIQLLIFSFSALATGGAVVAGQYLGDKQIDKAQNSATQLVWFSTILSSVLMILVIILRHFLIGLLFGQIEADVWHNADMYLYIVALSIPFIAIYNDTKENWMKEGQEHKVSYHEWSDNTRSAEPVAAYDIKAYPTFVIIDPNGKILDIPEEGSRGFLNVLKYIPDAEVEKKLKEALKS